MRRDVTELLVLPHHTDAQAALPHGSSRQLVQSPHNTPAWLPPPPHMASRPLARWPLRTSFGARCRLEGKEKDPRPRCSVCRHKRCTESGPSVYASLRLSRCGPLARARLLSVITPLYLRPTASPYPAHRPQRSRLHVERGCSGRSIFSSHFLSNNTHQPAHTPPPWPTRADRRRASIGESPLRHPVNNTSKQASRHLRRSTTAAAAAAVTHLPAGPGVAFSPASHRHRPTASRRSRSAETARCSP